MLIFDPSNARRDEAPARPLPLTRSAQPQRLRLLGSTAAVLLLAACANTAHRAPVEERRPQVRPVPPIVVSTPLVVQQPPGQAGAVDTGAAHRLPGAEFAGKAGYYTVKPGDTLIRIGLDHGQNWRDIARWSALSNPNILEVGQVLRVVPPVAVATAPAPVPAAVTPVPAAPAPPVAVAQPMGSNTVESRGLDAPAGANTTANTTPNTGASAAAGAASAAAGVTVSTSPAMTTPGGSAVTTAPTQEVPLPPSAPAATASDEDVTWAWPSAGTVVTVFDETKSKGLGIGGRAGDPVLAAADGRVVYAGSGLRGYGNLVIVKHNATYLTAYAHNQRLLVKEDQAVRRGQQIAEMGATDAERVKLHFEVRRQGKPIDPATVLPRR